MRKVLVIGQDGMLGGELYTRLLDSKKYEVYKTTIDTLDICSEDDVKNEVEKIKPYFIINCAAYTNVDACETNFEIANNVNGKAVLNIAKAANLVGATLIQISNVVPKNKEELLGIRGMGEKKYEKFGEELLDIINDYK